MQQSEPMSAVLTFWFGDAAVDDVSYEARRKLWFRKNDAVDAEIRDRFTPLYNRARAGELDAWQDSPAGQLALVILLDQFPRNMFRGTAQAFATDNKARAIAKRAIAEGDDRALPPQQRFFLYLPLEHSEDIADQHCSVELFQALAQDHADLADTYDYAIKHRDIIEQFGRFPHRNKALGRANTPQEQEFLKQPGSSF